MRNNLVWGFLVVGCLSGISGGGVAGGNGVISAGAVRPTSGPVKSAGVGVAAVSQKKDKKQLSASVNPATIPLSSEFRLGAVYVSPNPAKGGAVPVFHIETGIADNVNIKIYTVSGLPVHEHAITGLPQTLEKAGNLVYVYEYAWEGTIAPGLYYYNIEVEKAGQKLKTSGMVAVVR